MCNCSRLDYGLLSIFFMSLTTYGGISIMAPFFPSEAAQKGVSTSISGAVFAANAVGQFLMSSIVGKILPLIGSRIAFAVGLVSLGSSNVAFGLLEYDDNYTSFVTLAFTLRLIEACGSALIVTTTYMVLMKKCDNDNLAFNIAINQICSSIGYAVGPPVGSLFYSIGGFKLPFIVLGSIVLMNTPISLFFIENYKDNNEQNSEEEQRPAQNEEQLNLTYLKLMSIPKVFVAALAVTVVGIVNGNIAATLELYLKQYKVATKYVGYVFMATTFTYTACLLLSVKFINKFNYLKCILIGQLISALGCLLILPSPFFIAKGNVVVVIIALIVIGLGGGSVFLSTLPSISKTYQTIGYVANVHNTSLASGLWNSGYTLGIAIGSYCNALIFEHFGAQVCWTVVSIFLFISFISVCLSFLKCCDERQLDYILIDGVNRANIDLNEAGDSTLVGY